MIHSSHLCRSELPAVRIPIKSCLEIIPRRVQNCKSKSSQVCVCIIIYSRNVQIALLGKKMLELVLVIGKNFMSASVTAAVFGANTTFGHWRSVWHYSGGLRQLRSALASPSTFSLWEKEKQTQARQTRASRFPPPNKPLGVNTDDKNVKKNRKSSKGRRLNQISAFWIRFWSM